MTYSVQAYIIGKNDSREYDRIFTIYTKEHGKMTVLAQGVKKITSKLCGNLELFSQVTCILARGRALDRIAHVEMIDRFLPIKEQLEKHSAAHYFFEVFNYLVKDGQSDESLYELIRDFFSGLMMVGAGKAGVVSCASLVRLSMAMGYQGRSKGVVQSLQRAQSINTFAMRCTRQESRDLLQSAQSFIRGHCDRPLRSTAYFDFYALQKA